VTNNKLARDRIGVRARRTFCSVCVLYIVSCGNRADIYIIHAYRSLVSYICACCGRNTVIIRLHDALRMVKPIIRFGWLAQINLITCSQSVSTKDRLELGGGRTGSDREAKDYIYFIYPKL